MTQPLQLRRYPYQPQIIEISPTRFTNLLVCVSRTEILCQITIADTIIAEDTFILLDALEKDALELMALKPALVVEIGPGSGVVSSFLARLLQGEGQRPTALSLAVDLNPEACVTTKATGKLNDVSPP